jgi:diacylglycerol kinase family enzyme
LSVLLVYNPSAGGDEPEIDELVALLDGAGRDVVAQSIKDDDWSHALAGDLDLVAVAGGDGTVSKVFRELAGTELTATVIPVGSANNIARSLGVFDDDPGRLVQRWAGGRIARCDVGMLTAADRGEVFVESVGGGVFAEMLVRGEEDDAPPESDDKVELGLRKLADIVRRAPAREWSVAADGEDLSRELIAVEAMNIEQIGPNVPLAEGADTGDGLLDLVLIGPDDRDALLAYVEGRLAGRTVELPRLEVVRAALISLRVSAGAHLHADDEHIVQETSTELSIGIQRGVQVLVPAQV